MKLASGLGEDVLDRRPGHAASPARELMRHLADLVRPSASDWTARQLIHHLADAEIEDGVRLRRILTENTPVLHPWDDEHYSRHLHYERPVDVSLAAFNAVALSNIELLRLLSGPEWEREANQERLWPLTVEGWLEEKLTHLTERTMQIRHAIGAPHHESGEESVQTS